jgi:hypothetical protein
VTLSWQFLVYFLTSTRTTDLRYYGEPKIFTIKKNVKKLRTLTMNSIILFKNTIDLFPFGLFGLFGLLITWLADEGSVSRNFRFQSKNKYSTTL